MFRALIYVALRRLWPIIVATIIFFAVSGAAGVPVGALLQGGGFEDVSSGSVAARIEP
jgi:hypothetical protein